MVFETLDSAGLTDPQGRLAERKVPHGEITLPGNITLKEQNLCWKFDSKKTRSCRPSSDLLNQFVSLCDAKDSAIVKFAERWGPLRFDVDGQIVTALEGSEPLDYWRFLARRAYAVLAIAADLGRGGSPIEKFWKMISTPQQASKISLVETGSSGRFGFPNWARLELVFAPGGPEWGKRLSNEKLREQLAAELSFWLERFEPHMAIAWNPKKAWHLRIQYSGRILPAISLQLALVVSGGDLYMCDGCKAPYIRAGRRRPNAGQANFCTNCGDDKARKKADERRRDKMARARNLHGRVPISDIAKQLDTTTESVKRWLKKKES